MTTPSPWVDAQEVDAALLELEIISDIMMCVQELLAPDRAALYLDDKLVGEQPLAGVKLIGNHLIVGEDYTGLISEVKLFDEAKTPKEIAKP